MEILLIIIIISLLYLIWITKEESFINNHEIDINNCTFKKHLNRVLNKDGTYRNYNDNIIGEESVKSPIDMSDYYEINQDNDNLTTSKYDYHLDEKLNYFYDDGQKYDMTLDNNICDNTNRYFGDLFEQGNDKKNCVTNHLLKQNVIYNAQDIDKFAQDIKQQYGTTKIRHIYDKLVDGNYYDPPKKEMIKNNKFYVNGHNGKILTKDRWNYKNENINNGGIIDYKIVPTQDVSDTDTFFLTGFHKNNNQNKITQYIKQELYANDPSADNNLALI